VPLNTFATKTSAIPLSELDANFTFVSDSANLSFLQSGTGAVSRTVQAKARDVVSVKDFGAVGDGTTDDTAAIQAAITAVSAAGGFLFFPAGTYKTTAALTITTGSFGIIGQGRATRFAPSANVDVFTIGDNAAEISGLVFRDFRIWPTATLSAGYAFNCRLVSDSTWDEVYVGSVDDYVANSNAHRLYDGFYFDRFSQCTVEGGEIVVAQTGAKMRGKSDQTFGAELSFDGGLRIYKAGVNGVWLGGAAGGVYLGRVDISAAYRGVRCDDTLQTGIYNRELFISQLCTIDSCTGHAIKILDNGLENLNSQGVFVSGNGSAGFSTEAAISVDATTGVSVSANWGAIRLQRNYYDGMNLNSGIHSVAGGYIRSNGTGAGGGHGVMLANSAVAGFNCNGVTIHSNGTAGRGYGINNTAAADYTNICGNTFFSNGQGAVTGTLTGDNRIFGDDNAGATVAWQTYTPTITSSAGTITTVSSVSGRYRKTGRIIHIEIDFTVTTNGTGATRIDATYPSGIVAVGNGMIAGRVTGVGLMLQGLVADGSTSVAITTYDNVYPGADGRRLYVSGSFETTT